MDESVSSQEFYPVELKHNEDIPNAFIIPEDLSWKQIILFSGADSRFRIIPKYFNINNEDYDFKYRSQHSKHLINRWTTLLQEEDVYGEHWKKICLMFEICSHNELPFSTHNGFKAIRNDPELLVKLILSMWVNDTIELLKQEIDYFEQEMAIAFHWISANIWQSTINKMIAAMPSVFQSSIIKKLQELFEHLKDIFDSTLSPKISSDFLRHINESNLDKADKITKSEINEFKTKIKGISDTNNDLPVIRIPLKGSYYTPQAMPVFYKVMMESAMVAAESAASINQGINLFSPIYKENSRVINFYRKYYRENYSEIFIRTLKIINSKRK
ncbi:MAG: hypothetical protein K2L45_05860 [Muribaculaceae bacterium]|nr:hypothetical protein [Muribaculaceae bacterium]